MPVGAIKAGGCARFFVLRSPRAHVDLVVFQSHCGRLARSRRWVMKIKTFGMGMVAGVLCAFAVASADDRAGVALPEAVRAAIQRAYPQATIGKTERERVSITVYEVALQDGATKVELAVGSDGTIFEEERAVERS